MPMASRRRDPGLASTCAKIKIRIAALENKMQAQQQELVELRQTSNVSASPDGRCGPLLPGLGLAVDIPV
jgi:hypothetical protein